MRGSSPTSMSPLGALIAEIRQDARRESLAGAAESPSLARTVPPLLLWPVSLLLHGGLVLAAIVGPLIGDAPLPPPRTPVAAFLVTPVRWTHSRPPAPAVHAERERPHATRRRLQTVPAAPRMSVPIAPRPKARPPIGERTQAARTGADSSPLAARSDMGTAAIETTGTSPGRPGDHGAPGPAPHPEAEGSHRAGAVSSGAASGPAATVDAPAPATDGPVEPPRRTPPASGPVRLGDGIREPRKLKHVEPVYPDIAVRANVQGVVVLECTVSPQGRVTSVSVVRGAALLEDAAVAAVRQWVYTPTLRDGVPVAVLLTVSVQFQLEDRRRTFGPDPWPRDAVRAGGCCHRDQLSLDWA